MEDKIDAILRRLDKLGLNDKDYLMLLKSAISELEYKINRSKK